jgi:hypothetical protein
MKKMNSTSILMIIFLFVVGGFFGYIFGLRAFDALPDSPYEIEMYKNQHMKEYLSITGTFTLQYPEDAAVYEENGVVTIAPEPTDANPNPDPYMTIGVEDDRIIFATWNDLKFEYFKPVVSSFEFWGE